MSGPFSNIEESNLKEEVKIRPKERLLLPEEDKKIITANSSWRKRIEASFVYVKNLPNEENENVLYWILFLLFAIMAVWSRLYCISQPYNVIWDEAHFGKFSSWYLNRTYFFDVHPPGGKLLLAFFGYISGYNGTYAFTVPGNSYQGYDEIIYMRVCCALVGAMMILLSFSTVWNLTYSLIASSLAALFCTFETGTIALSKFILLDPLLMTAMMAAFHGMVMFQNQRQRPWKCKWWLMLLYTGISLGLVISVKFVGVFIVAVVGLYTANDLWRLFSDMNVTLFSVFRHLLARILCLILIPAAVYIGIFFIHDQVLYSVQSPALQLGDLGVGGFSPKFQMGLINSSLYNRTQPKYLTYGSLVFFKIDEIGGGYLHSHNYTYPTKYISGNRQQITTMRGKDINNNFRILFPMDDPEMINGYYGDPQERILDQNWVRLHHHLTNATVACHPTNKSLMASKLTFVYGHPYNLTDPEIVANLPEIDEDVPFSSLEFQYDLWRIKLENPVKADQPIEGFETRFQLINGKMGCALTWSKEKLPNKWGYGQGEAACTKNLQDPNSFWTIEEITNPYDSMTKTYTSDISFLSRFIETHQVMTWVNARLKPETYDPDAHQAWHWPIQLKIQPWYNVESLRVVLIGNPLIFFINFLTLIGSPLYLLWIAFRSGRLDSPKYDTKESECMEKRMFAIRWLLVAYMLHYFPFLLMQRILYFHHYFPAVQFSSMLSAVVIVAGFRQISKLFKPSLRSIIFKLSIFLIVFLLFLSFAIYAQAAYGYPLEGAYNHENSTFKHYKVYDWWEI